LLADKGADGADGTDGVDGAPGADGADGVDGADGSPGAAGAPGMVWKGEWDSGATYVTTDVVQYLGTSYIALSGNTNVEPGTDGGVTWDVVAAAGSGGGGGGGFTHPQIMSRISIGV
jgi:hypothetical protein